MNAVRALQRLQKAAKRRASQSEQEQQEHRADNEEQPLHQEGGDEATATTVGGAVVLDMEGQQQEERPLQLDTLGLGVPQHHVVKSVVELPSPPIISEAEEQGLDLLAHAMVADACAARAEAAEMRAAAADSDEADPDLRPLLMGLDSPRASGAGGAPLVALPSSDLAAAAAAAAAPESVVESAPAVQAPVPKRRNPLQRRRVQHAPQHSAQQGRKAVIMAKQQLVKTLTLSKHGETVEMELPIKELLRYIQGAVRTVHISQYPARGSIGGASCVDKDKSETLILRDASGSVGARVGPEPPEVPTLQRPRVFSHGSVASAAGGTRMGPPMPVGGLLNARDVRRLISGLDTESVKSKEMSILVRRHTVVLNLDVIRCLVLWDRLIVVVPEGADSHCLQHLSENLRWLRVQQRAFDMDADEDEGEEFEFLALEAVLLTVCNQLKSQLKDLRLPIAKNSKALLGKGTLNTKHQDALRQLKSKVAAYQSKVRSLHRAIFDLLDDEEHIQMLHLTRIYAQQQQQLLLAAAGAGAETDAAAGATGAGDADRDDEAEVLLESFLHECSELIAKWDLVKEDMGNTENFCLMQLDLARNRLLTIGTLFALANLCFAFGSMIAGIYGMNLFNGISEGSGSPNSLPFFIGVVSFILVVMVVGGGSILTWMHQSRILVA